jgi:hypothetical protein
MTVPRSTEPSRGIVNRLYTCRWVEEGSTKTVFFNFIPDSFWLGSRPRGWRLRGRPTTVRDKSAQAATRTTDV